MAKGEPKLKLHAVAEQFKGLDRNSAPQKIEETVESIKNQAADVKKNIIDYAAKFEGTGLSVEDKEIINRYTNEACSQVDGVCESYSEQIRAINDNIWSNKQRKKYQDGDVNEINNLLNSFGQDSSKAEQGFKGRLDGDYETRQTTELRKDTLLSPLKLEAWLKKECFDDFGIINLTEYLKMNPVLAEQARLLNYHFDKKQAENERINPKTLPLRNNVVDFLNLLLDECDRLREQGKEVEVDVDKLTSLLRSLSPKARNDINSKRRAVGEKPLAAGEGKAVGVREKMLLFGDYEGFVDNVKSAYSEASILAFYSKSAYKERAKGLRGEKLGSYEQLLNGHLGKCQEALRVAQSGQFANDSSGQTVMKFLELLRKRGEIDRAEAIKNKWLEFQVNDNKNRIRIINIYLAQTLSEEQDKLDNAFETGDYKKANEEFNNLASANLARGISSLSAEDLQLHLEKLLNSQKAYNPKKPIRTIEVSHTVKGKVYDFKLPVQSVIGAINAINPDIIKNFKPVKPRGKYATMGKAEAIFNLFDKGRIMSAFIPSNEGVSGLEATDHQYEKWEDRVRIEGDGYDGEQLTVEKLSMLGVKPEFQVQIAGTNMFLSKVITGGSRLSLVVFVEQIESGKKILIPRGYYFSNSQGVWRHAPNYDFSWIGKGGSDKNSEDHMTAPFELQQKISSLICVDNVKENCLELGRNDRNLVLYGSGKFLNKGDSLYKGLEGEMSEPIYLPGNLFSNNGKELVKPEVLDVPTEYQPEFSNKIASWGLPSDLYGFIEYEAFKSKNEDIVYTFCTTGDGKVWIGSIEGLGELNSHGIRREPVSAGDLTTPAFEYNTATANQTGGYGGGELKGDYENISENYHKNIPIIKNYLAYKRNVPVDTTNESEQHVVTGNNKAGNTNEKLDLTQEGEFAGLKNFQAIFEKINEITKKGLGGFQKDLPLILSVIKGEKNINTITESNGLRAMVEGLKPEVIDKAQELVARSIENDFLVEVSKQEFLQQEIDRRNELIGEVYKTGDFGKAAEFSAMVYWLNQALSKELELQDSKAKENPAEVIAKTSFKYEAVVADSRLQITALREQMEAAKTETSWARKIFIGLDKSVKYNELKAQFEQALASHRELLLSSTREFVQAQPSGANVESVKQQVLDTVLYEAEFRMAMQPKDARVDNIMGWLGSEWNDYQTRKGLVGKGAENTVKTFSSIFGKMSKGLEKGVAKTVSLGRGEEVEKKTAEWLEKKKAGKYIMAGLGIAATVGFTGLAVGGVKGLRYLASLGMGAVVEARNISRSRSADERVSQTKEDISNAELTDDFLASLDLHIDEYSQKLDEMTKEKSRSNRNRILAAVAIGGANIAWSLEHLDSIVAKDGATGLYDKVINGKTSPVAPNLDQLRSHDAQADSAHQVAAKPETAEGIRNTAEAVTAHEAEVVRIEHGDSAWRLVRQHLEQQGTPKDQLNLKTQSILLKNGYVDGQGNTLKGLREGGAFSLDENNTIHVGKNSEYDFQKYQVEEVGAVESTSAVEEVEDQEIVIESAGPYDTAIKNIQDKFGSELKIIGYDKDLSHIIIRDNADFEHRIGLANRPEAEIKYEIDNVSKSLSSLRESVGTKVLELKDDTGNVLEKKEVFGISPDSAAKILGKKSIINFDDADFTVLKFVNKHLQEFDGNTNRAAEFVAISEKAGFPCNSADDPELHKFLVEKYRFLPQGLTVDEKAGLAILGHDDMRTDMMKSGAIKTFGKGILGVDSEIVRSKNGVVNIVNAFGHDGYALRIFDNKISIIGPAKYLFGEDEVLGATDITEKILASGSNELNIIIAKTIKARADMAAVNQN
ncbi:MAG: hypothetical protein WCG01_02620 [bacterium]